MTSGLMTVIFLTHCNIVHYQIEIVKNNNIDKYAELVIDKEKMKLY